MPIYDMMHACMPRAVGIRYSIPTLNVPRPCAGRPVMIDPKNIRIGLVSLVALPPEGRFSLVAT